MIILRICIFVKSITEVMLYLSQYIISEDLMTGDVNLDHLIKVLPAEFLYCKIIIFSL